MAMMPNAGVLPAIVLLFGIFMQSVEYRKTNIQEFFIQIKKIQPVAKIAARHPAR
ncbi:hypothetical protein SAMN05421788_107226 [Filimonas lacunae]|uniref:Uncharacterized protein n=1 Tax=Filimonas lacunae TaxID=477680 RepID=A0A173MG10_9BACT|nr:hypothetical protein [Filimonas lacunae]BAV06562.1 hypothetical protein FLA_2581 [Filimonas lacunae]SIT27402.1 hypothetical protein SAMN05421788_107226 [Filimonas lacunae]